MRAALAVTSGQQELIRWVAMATMIVDHVGATLLEPTDALPLRAVGRVAWPLFAYLLAYNTAVRGVDPTRYLRPLLIWYVISIIPYALAFDLFRPNILATLLLAALAILALQRWEELGARHPLLPPLVVIAILAAGSFVEYGVPGVLLPVGIWWALTTGRPLAWAATVLLVALQNFPWSVWPFALIALPIPYFATLVPARLPRMRRYAWAFYPVHLLILGLVRHLA